MDKKTESTENYLVNPNLASIKLKPKSTLKRLKSEQEYLAEKSLENFNDKYREELEQIRVGRNYIVKMLYREALSIFDGLILKCADIKPIYRECLKWSIVCLNSIEKYKEVFKLCDEALLVNDGLDSEQLLIFKIRSLNNLGRYEDAINCANALLSMDINNKDALYLKGEALNQLQRPQEAIRCLERAAKIAPADKGIERSLALSRCLYYRGLVEISKALEYFEVPLEFVLNCGGIEGKNFMRCYKADLLITMGEYEGAVKLCEEIISIDPDYIPAWEKKAEAYFYLGDEEESEKIYAMIQAKKEQKEKGPAQILYFPVKLKK